MSESELPPSDAELRQAAELAEALESADPASSRADEPLGTARLLRHAQESARPLPPLRLPPRRRSRLWIPAAVGAALAAGLAFFVLRPPPAPSLPEVLAAQAQAVNARDPAILDAAMRPYRDRYLARLARQYREAP
jgi:hypothetical protein